jgi:hypothetical protein
MYRPSAEASRQSYAIRAPFFGQAPVARKSCATFGDVRPSERRRSRPRVAIPERQQLGVQASAECIAGRRIRLCRMPFRMRRPSRQFDRAKKRVDHRLAHARATRRRSPSLPTDGTDGMHHAVRLVVKRLPPGNTAHVPNNCSLSKDRRVSAETTYLAVLRPRLQPFRAKAEVCARAAVRLECAIRLAPRWSASSRTSPAASLKTPNHRGDTEARSAAGRGLRSAGEHGTAQTQPDKRSTSRTHRCSCGSPRT